MLNNSELQSLIIEVATKYYPEEMKDAEIIIRSKNQIDLESDFIKSIITDFRLAYHGERFNATSMSYNSCKALAKALKEQEMLIRLEEIRDGKKQGISVPHLEYYLLKSLKPNVFGKKIIRIAEKEFSTGALNDLLLKSKEEIYLLFCEIQGKYNIKEDKNWIQQVQQNAKVNFNELGL